jgi:hypothetical protein
MHNLRQEKNIELVGLHETGCHSAVANEIALYVQATSHLHFRRHQLYKRVASMEKRWTRDEFDHTIALHKEGEQLFRDACDQLSTEVYRGVNPPVVGRHDCADFLGWLAREYVDFVSDANGLVA